MRSLIRAKSSNSDTSNSADDDRRATLRQETSQRTLASDISTLEMYRALPKNHQTPGVGSQFFPDV
jgi:hypothetical protein